MHPLADSMGKELRNLPIIKIMTSTPKPAKNPPPNLHLTAKPNFRLPFSSPMGEEIISPTSPPNLPPNPIQRPRNMTLDGADEDNSEPKTQRFSVPKSPKRTSTTKYEKATDKSRWPGLNVVTNFSKPPVLAETDARNRMRRKESKNAGPGAVSLSEIKTPVDGKAYRDFKTHKRNKGSGGRTMRPDGELRLREESGRRIEKHSAAGLGLEGLENPPANNSLHPGRDNLRVNSPGQSSTDSTRITELSPSDRPIMIGIAIPSAKLAEHSMSPEVSLSGSNNLNNHHYGTDRDPPATPTIIVTPAADAGTWPSDPYEQIQIQYRHRAASEGSPHAFYHSRGAEDVPPIPARPRAFPQNSIHPFDNGERKESQPRVVSSCTIFDEDDIKVRPYSGESQLRILKRSSMDTIATRHRSQGWWNHILSPFMTRTNTMMFKVGSPEVGDPVPALPTANQEGTTLRGQYIKDADRISPREPGDETPKDHRSIWTGSSRFQSEGQNIELTSNHTPGPSPLSFDSQTRDIGDATNSNTPLPFEGFGAAAEYYQACWHDQNSPTRYFECQNHACSSPEGDQIMSIGFLDADVSKSISQKPSFGPGLSQAQSHEEQQIYDFQRTPANQFSAAFSQVVKSKPTPRALSEVTDIEDLASTPEVSEAHMASMFRAGAPTLAAQPLLPGAGPASQTLMAEPERPPATGIPLHRQLSSRQPPSETAGPSQEKTVIPSPSIVDARAPALGVQPPQPRATPQTLIPGSENPTERTRTQPYPQLSPNQRPESGDIPLAVQLPSSHPPKAAAFSRSSQTSSRQPLEFYSRSQSTKPPTRSIPVMPPDFSRRQQPSASESGELSMPHSGDMTFNKAAVAGVISEDTSQSAQSTYIINQYHDNSSRWKQREADLLAGSERLSRAGRRGTISGEKREKNAFYQEDRQRRNCLGLRNCFKRKKPATKRKKRLLFGITISLIILIILIVALAMTLARKSGKTQVEKTTQWLNMTGFPPIPTGISTIIQPDAALESSKCVQPDTMWSCAVPKEEQQSIAPNDPDQPNFRVEIRFRNGTSANSTSSGISKSSKRSRTSFTGSASNFVRSRCLQARDSFSSSSFSPSPSPPSQEDQAFLGNTTDKNALPFDGETTPFFLSVLPASKTASSQRLAKRADGNSSFPDLTSLIPPPDINSDGTAASANLHPFPVAQPLRLYDRGLATEHYGFYTYYDRSIFLKSAALLDDSASPVGDVPDDRDGGATKAAATVRCTWTQTRFLVQIWTKQGTDLKLLGNSSHTDQGSAHQPQNLTSANEFSRPGSFPYPVTVTLDRHGGDISKKLIYCYGLDNRERIITTRKNLQLEDRGAGGVLVNSAQGPFATTKVLKEDGGPGGADGGTGGCGCRWINFEGRL